ncbi:7-carboxy-7-deazaguanine synthase QueE [Fulvivirga sp. RKSG066]|uniref:7-carboxy-7-deazaguanine synthase QueE n=1 Tax=Fulvivirga aurantia TaxID=2529383 RepID=UPI0012BC54AD|nr:7-carboxy-7-deazaguanine synthase QueE [Fulvivirga aurantia]MTI21175.1 7-carboxy-7-deazaguanine synthase QueE [Fulvivirga aurantia]
MKLARLNNKAEIFYTVQGEGKNLGKPSIFLRTSLCNLHCIWCDTDYTWNWENTPFETTKNVKYRREEYIEELSPKEAAEIVMQYPCKHVVLTGGEPMMQQEALCEVIEYLKAQDDYTFEVETNGTLPPSERFDELVDQFNVSPKLANSNNSEKIREKPKALKHFSQSAKSNFKFVLSQEEDLNEILSLIEKYNINPAAVYLMPEGVSEVELKRKQSWLVEICKTHGFNYTDRLHIHIYGAKRGV